MYCFFKKTEKKNRQNDEILLVIPEVEVGIGICEDPVLCRYNFSSFGEDLIRALRRFGNCYFDRLKAGFFKEERDAASLICDPSNYEYMKKKLIYLNDLFRLQSEVVFQPFFEMENNDIYFQEKDDYFILTKKGAEEANCINKDKKIIFYQGMEFHRSLRKKDIMVIR